MMTRIVVALGGNALGNTPEEQKRSIEAACGPLVDLIEQGNEIIVCHGNGPQVGMINLAFGEASAMTDKVCPMELPECTAMSQGYIGFHLQNGLRREMHRRGMPWKATTVVTQVVVDKNDPAFANPTKPIGAFCSEEQAREMMAQDPSVRFIEDSGRGWRRVVPSPEPEDIVEKASIADLLDREYVVIACGGGGIPVVIGEDGDPVGVSAVIDKDLSAALLADKLGCSQLFILTAVENVCINFGRPDEKRLETMTVAEAERYMAEGQFAPGSMLPKVRAAVRFVRGGEGRSAVIGALDKAALAVSGRSGTRIIR